MEEELSLENESEPEEGGGREEDDGDKKTSKPRKYARIVINVSDTQYPVVRWVAKKYFHWRLTYDPEDPDFDLWWTDSAVQPEKLARMRPYQKINHFPGMYGLARKNYLARNLTKLRKIFPQEFDFFPLTWVLPAEHGEMKTYALKNPRTTFIVKPEASCQGRGIFLTRNPDDLDVNDRYVVQKYLDKPFLIEDLKFDLRVYVLVAGCDPLRIFVHEEGLTRLATEEYVAPGGANLEDMCMHLTNYAVNKHNPNFVFNEDEEEDDIGHKRSLTSTMKLLEDMGKDVAALKRDIADIVIKTLCSVQPSLAHIYKSCQPEDRGNACCFEVLGFDIILDSALKPWLLEVNHSPSFTTDTPLDKKIKRQVISEALTLLNVNPKTKRRYLAHKTVEIQQRAIQGKQVKETKEEREAAVAKAGRIRDKWEAKHLGGYTKVFPCGDDRYDKYTKAAANLWEEWTGGNINRVKKEDTRREDLLKRPPKNPPSRGPKEPQTAKSPSVASSTSFSTREKRSQSVSGCPADGPKQDEKPAVPSVFERLSKVKVSERRLPTPLSVLPNIYWADDALMTGFCVPGDRVYKTVTDAVGKRPALTQAKDRGGKRSLVSTLEASLRDRGVRPDFRGLNTPLKIQALDTQAGRTVGLSPKEGSPGKGGRQGAKRRV